MVVQKDHSTSCRRSCTHMIRYLHTTLVSPRAQNTLLRTLRDVVAKTDDFLSFVASRLCNTQ